MDSWEAQRRRAGLKEGQRLKSKMYSRFSLTAGFEQLVLYPRAKHRDAVVRRHRSRTATTTRDVMPRGGETACGAIRLQHAYSIGRTMSIFFALGILGDASGIRVGCGR